MMRLGMGKRKLLRAISAGFCVVAVLLTGTLMFLGSAHAANDANIVIAPDWAYTPGGGTATITCTGFMQNDFTSVTTGSNFTCGIRGANKQAWCWGTNYNGEMARGMTSMREGLAAIPDTANFTNENVRQISAGSGGACLVKTDNSLYCWGVNMSAQIGNGTQGSSVLSPFKVMDNVQSVAYSNGTTCAVKTDGMAWCWGNANGDGILLHGYDQYPEIFSLSTPDKLIPGVPNTGRF